MQRRCSQTASAWVLIVFSLSRRSKVSRGVIQSVESERQVVSSGKLMDPTKESSSCGLWAEESSQQQRFSRVSETGTGFSERRAVQTGVDLLKDLAGMQEVEEYRRTFVSAIPPLAQDAAVSKDVLLIQPLPRYPPTKRQRVEMHLRQGDDNFVSSSLLLSRERAVAHRWNEGTRLDQAAAQQESSTQSPGAEGGGVSTVGQQGGRMMTLGSGMGVTALHESYRVQGGASEFLGRPIMSRMEERSDAWNSTENQDSSKSQGAPGEEDLVEHHLMDTSSKGQGIPGRNYLEEHHMTGVMQKHHEEGISTMPAKQDSGSVHGRSGGGHFVGHQMMSRMQTCPGEGATDEQLDSGSMRGSSEDGHFAGHQMMSRMSVGTGRAGFSTHATQADFSEQKISHWQSIGATSTSEPNGSPCPTRPSHGLSFQEHVHQSADPSVMSQDMIFNDDKEASRLELKKIIEKNLEEHRRQCQSDVAYYSELESAMRLQQSFCAACNSIGNAKKKVSSSHLQLLDKGLNNIVLHKYSKMPLTCLGAEKARWKVRQAMCVSMVLSSSLPPSAPSSQFSLCSLFSLFSSTFSSLSTLPHLLPPNQSDKNRHRIEIFCQEEEENLRRIQEEKNATQVNALAQVSAESKKRFKHVMCHFDLLLPRRSILNRRSGSKMLHQK